MIHMTAETLDLADQYCGKRPTTCDCYAHTKETRVWWGGRTVNARKDSRTLRIVGDIRKSVEEAYSAKDPYVEYDRKTGIIPLPR